MSGDRSDCGTIGEMKDDCFNDESTLLTTDALLIVRTSLSVPLQPAEDEEDSAISSQTVKRQKLDSDSVQRAIRDAVDAATVSWLASNPPNCDTNHTPTNGSADSATLPQIPSDTATDIDIMQEDGLSLPVANRPSAPIQETTQSSASASDGAATQNHNGVDATAETPMVQSSSTTQGPSSTATPTTPPGIETDVVTNYKKLDELPYLSPLPTLTPVQTTELEVALQLDPTDPDEWWRDDWMGNLALMQKEVANPSIRRRKVHKSEVTQTIWEWAQSQHSSHHTSNSNTTSNTSLRLARNLLALVYHQAPPAAQRILAYASSSWEQDPAGFDIFDAIKRCSYDPAVLREDGWTTAPPQSDEFEGSASGGPMHIGKTIFWEGYDAVVIAYVLDSEIGDLWKAMWLDANETFDLEAEELQKAIKKWERKYKKLHEKKEIATLEATSAYSSARFAAVRDFSVEGIEHGIIQATTYSPLARRGVFWPARVLHVSELDKSQTLHKRNSAKQKVTVVFFAPYWNTGASHPLGICPSPDYPLFEIESIDVSEATIQKYPHDGHRGINIHQNRNSFRFTGLPKYCYGRYLDSHRIAMALKLYAQQELMTRTSKPHNATAALFDTHALAINTARFPAALLNLPFQYILSKLPTPGKEKPADAQEDVIEPTLRLADMMKAMEPPRCFGGEPGEAIRSNSETNNGNGISVSTVASPLPNALLARTDSSRLVVASDDDLDVKSILSEYLEDELTKLATTDLPSASLFADLSRLVLRANRISGEIASETNAGGTKTNVKLKSLLQECLRMKSYGEDTLAADWSILEKQSKLILIEWRKSCERLFKFVTIRCSYEGFGSGVTIVLSDSRCNQHITNEGCVERAVRLPAALKGAKLAGAGATPSCLMQLSVEEYYMKLATDKFLEKAHTVSYLKKMKARCSAIAPNVNGAHLTEGSDGEGGCDTTGARGTYDAAVAGVASAMKAIDLIVGGQCVNVFCATRPPGHHAGRNLHAMGAVSNGFCVLNPVACAAIYATTPPSEGGLGLKRVVVIDFDVHHGNGTQDILCSTYDPRFLYVSMHAGGAHINGYETDDSDADPPRVGSQKQEGIFPGRCGDTSPHKGVLNLPLGARVTPHEVGNALVCLIEPAVEAFSPDIIILSAGFDGHKNDPLGMGGLSAHDFGHITEVACAMAFRFCSGRIMSVLEGGYGVPCCRPQKDVFLPPSLPVDSTSREGSNFPEEMLATADSNPSVPPQRSQPFKLMDLGENLPEEMDDQVTPGLQRKLDKCHTEGFLDCVREHVSSLKKNNSRS